jgi:hypothetical protein
VWERSTVGICELCGREVQWAFANCVGEKYSGHLRTVWERSTVGIYELCGREVQWAFTNCVGEKYSGHLRTVWERSTVGICHLSSKTDGAKIYCIHYFKMFFLEIGRGCGLDSSGSG